MAAEEFRAQLTVGVPTDADEKGLRRLARQIKAKKVCVKLFLRHTLHAKLYLLFRPDKINPIVGYLGSSNLTLSGLSHQGELNIDVLDKDELSTQLLLVYFGVLVMLAAIKGVQGANHYGPDPLASEERSPEAAQA